MYIDPDSGNFTDDGFDTGVAIVGMACRFARARGLDAYWSLLSEGREAFTTFTDEELLAAGVSPQALRKDNYVRSGAPLEDMECFDAGLFGLSPRDAAIMDPQHRHFLECTWEALENAGHTPQRFEGVIGVFAGTGHNAYMPYNLLTNSKLIRDVGLFLLRHTSNDKDFLTTRVSYLFDLKGPSINIQTACSTSLVSIHMAAQSLLNGECDMALAGGASIELPHRQGYVYEEGEILSPDGHCRPFNVNSQGTVFGSGAGIVVLRRLSDAMADGDHIYAVLRGSAVNNDGASKVGYLAPSVDGQAKVIAEALAISGVDAGTIGYVEAHGTGTPVGDPIEIAALTSAYRQFTDQTGYCGIGSAKGNIGHTDTAAGVAGVIKVALAMHNAELPATLGFTAPNPSCALEGSPFVVQGEPSPWPRSPGRPRRAGVSSLGVGGTNAHVVLEEPPLRGKSGPSRRRQLLLLSAKSDTALAGAAVALSGHLANESSTDLADVAFTLTLGRQHLARRHFAVAETVTEAASRLSLGAVTPVPCVLGRGVSFLFCGAGPQHIDMARDLYDAEASFRADVDKALAILDRIGERDLRRWLFPTEADREQAAAELQRPSIALPALFIIQTALARLWISVGIQPTGMIGHSSGEYAAAYLAGVIDLESGLRIVSTRGRLFEKTAPGGMLSVPLTEAELGPLLPAELAIATINAPRLCVVSGPAGAIARFHQDLESQDIEAQAVRISVAAHSSMLDPILPEFRALMRTIPLRAPEIPFASNLTGDWVSAGDVTDPEYWVRHLRETVRFTDGLKRLLVNPESVLLEVGPGRSMASLARQHPDRDRQQPVVHSLPHPDQVIAHDAHWLEALGQLWALGVTVDWTAFWADQQRLKRPLPTYCFDRDRHWVEPGTLPVLANDDGLVRRSDTADWQFEPVWTRTAMPDPAIAEGTALVLEDDAGLGAQITERLRAEGRDVVVVRADSRFRRFSDDRFSIDPGSRCDYGRIFDALSAEERLPTQVFHCWLVSGEAKGKKLKVDHQLQIGLFSLTAMVPELARQLGGASVEFALVSDHAQRIAQDSAPVPAKAAAIGSARVISTEYPMVHVRAIDVALPAADNARALRSLAGNLLGELVAPWEARPICYRSGERWVLDYRPSESRAALPVAELAVQKDAVFVVTGGLGGLGLTIAQHLAQTQGARIALIARSGLPPREKWPDLLADGSVERSLQDKIRRLMALEASGATVQVFEADVANVAAMRKAVRAIVSKLGPIRGVFHAAGSLDDGLIETRTRTAMEAVLLPKVQGTLALDAALRGQPIDFLMLFSSVSALAGLPGQVDYAAANAFLDAYAQARNDDPVTRVISVGWSQWREVGMAAELNRQGGIGASLPKDLGDGTEVDHPFLQRLHALSLDEFVVTGTLSPETHWLLDEHRIDGAGALIPGTGYLELARAAHALIDPQIVALSDVTFLAPCFVPDGSARELRVHLRRRVGNDWRFVILGRNLGNDGVWVEHAVGTCCAQSLARAPAPLDLAGLAARCSVTPVGGNEASSVLRFGPRWDNMRSIAVSRDEALIHLALDPAYRQECGTVLLHPALLDLATAGAQILIPEYDPRKDFFAPFSYRWIVLHAPLPSTIVSHVRYRANGEVSGATATFDVTIADPSGRVLAEISEFSMMRVADTTAMAKARDGAQGAANTATSARDTMLDGILPEEGIGVIDEILRGRDRPHVIVSPYELGAAIGHLRTPRRAARPRESASRDDDCGDLPETAMEQTIAELWSDLLGIDPIFRNDDFFDLGGHSLLAVQFVNRLRKTTGKTLPLAALLAEPTIAGLARELEPESAASDLEEDKAANTSRRDVVTIRGGGSLTPIFFVHDGLGETLLYRGLALRLDGARPIYGIEPLRTPTGTFAHTSITEMAANYIARMKTIQTEGPYLLTGLCAGGVIAFEMAKQLEDGGAGVAFVGIIDAADVALKKLPFYTTRARLKRIRSLMRESELKVLLPSLGHKAMNAVRWEISSRLEESRNRRMVQSIRKANTAESPEVESSRTEAGEEAISFLKLYEVAHQQHRPEGILNGDGIVLFKAMEGNGEKDDIAYSAVYGDYALGWGRRVASEVTVVPVPGGHSSVLQEPNVGTLAQVFQESVDCAISSIERLTELKTHESFDLIVAEAAE